MCIRDRSNFIETILENIEFISPIAKIIACTAILIVIRYLSTNNRESIMNQLVRLITDVLSSEITEYHLDFLKSIEMNLDCQELLSLIYQVPLIDESFESLIDISGEIGTVAEIIFNRLIK